VNIPILSVVSRILQSIVYQLSRLPNSQFAIMVTSHTEQINSTSTASVDPEESQRPSPHRASTAPATVNTTGQKSTRPDWILTCCYMLVYLELGWLVTLLWRSYGRPVDGIRGLAGHE
jgi:hypothetical protein